MAPHPANLHPSFSTEHVLLWSINRKRSGGQDRHEWGFDRYEREPLEKDWRKLGMAGVRRHFRFDPRANVQYVAVELPGRPADRLHNAILMCARDAGCTVLSMDEAEALVGDVVSA